MRYQSVQGFKKHLISASPDHLAHSYMIAAPDEHERKKALRLVLNSFSGRAPVFFDGGTVVFQEVADALISPSLFGGEPLIVLENVDKMGKKEAAVLAEALDVPRAYGVFVGAAAAKNACMAAVEKRGVVLDLLEEKPWDREKRLLASVMEKAISLEKRMTPETASFLVARLGTDAALLDTEVEKLACFIGERAEIERQDIVQLSPQTVDSLWELAEAVVWGTGEVVAEDVSFYGILPLLRAQLEIGAKIAQLIRLDVARAEWGAYLPRYLYGKKLEERVAQTLRLKPPFFQAALKLLFEIETLSRSGASNESALFDFFRVSLRHAKG